MEKENHSTLPLILVLFTGIGLISSLTWLGSNFISFEATISRALQTIFTLALAGMVGWASVAGRSIGVKPLGSISGWIYVGLELISLALSLAFSYMLSKYSYSDIAETIPYITGAISIIGYFAIIAFALFLVGSRAWAVIKIVTPSLMLLAAIAGLTWHIFGSFMINNIAHVISMGVSFTLALIWKIRN